MEQKLIIFVGMPGSGKSICVEHLKNKGLASVYFGGITIDEVKKRGLDLTPENEKIVREDIRKHQGNEAYAKIMIKEIESFDGNQPVVVDGLYSWTEYKLFKSTYGNNAVVIAVVAPMGLRHQRLEQRPKRPLSNNEASDRDYAEIENLEKGGPIANADYFLSNTEDKSQLLNSLDELLGVINISI
ncbi:dephospho-CoA kinase [bacterium]|nr:dephospho-CoA kinase [bacterium]